MIPVEPARGEQRPQYDESGFRIELELAAVVVPCIGQQQPQDVKVVLVDESRRLMECGERAGPGRWLAVSAGLESGAPVIARTTISRAALCGAADWRM